MQKGTLAGHFQALINAVAKTSEWEGVVTANTLSFLVGRHDRDHYIFMKQGIGQLSVCVLRHKFYYLLTGFLFSI